MGFKFSVGETVAHKSSIEGIAFSDAKATKWQETLPNLAVVVSLLQEECSGGVQFHYLVRVGWHPSVIQVSEVELMSLPEALERWKELQGRQDAKIK